MGLASMRGMSTRTRISAFALGVALVAFAVAPRAEAKVYDEAKFKVLSLSGSESMTFHEDSTNPPYGRCAGTTSWRLSYRSTEPEVGYVVLRRIHGRLKTLPTPTRKPPQLHYLPMEGVATVSSTVDYQETAGCNEFTLEDQSCPEATVSAAPALYGTDLLEAGISAGVNDVESECSTQPPMPAGPVRYEPRAGFAGTIPRADLFNEKRKRLEGSVRVETPLTQEPSSTDDGTLTGTYTDEISVVLKRKKLED